MKKIILIFVDSSFAKFVYNKNEKIDIFYFVSGNSSIYFDKIKE